MSDAPQQHGWQPPESPEPDEQAQAESQRGFGLFEAPSAPDEFPVFTPYTPPADDSYASSNDFPPDGGGSPSFPGFPAEEQPHVPAPAVMPIPGIAHDAFQSDTPMPPPAPPEVPDIPSLGGSGDSWPAFAAGEPSRPEEPIQGDLPPFPGFESPASYESSYQPSPYEPSPPAFDPIQEPIAPQAIPPQPGPPAAESASGAVTGSARVSAAVPMANRITPAEEPPPAMPKPVGRVYGSAAATASPPAQESAPLEVPGAATPPHPEEPPTTPIRAAARPVHVSQPDPTDAVPSGRSSTIYGSSANAAAAAPPVAPPPVPAPAPGQIPGAPMPASRPGRQHAFGDLFQPTGAPGSPVPPPPPHGPGVPMQRVPQQAGQQMAASGTPAPPLMPPHDFEQAPAEPKPERKGLLIVGVLAGCATLLAVAFGLLLLLSNILPGGNFLSGSPTFEVGDCVKQSGSDAVAADCSEAGAFKVVASVASQQECDQTQPFVQQNAQVLCLQPASAATNETPQTQPTQSP